MKNSNNLKFGRGKIRQRHSKSNFHCSLKETQKSFKGKAIEMDKVPMFGLPANIVLMIKPDFFITSLHYRKSHLRGEEKEKLLPHTVVERIKLEHVCQVPSAGRWGLTKDWTDIYHPKQLIILCHSLQLRGSGVKYMNRGLFQKKAKSGLLWVGAQEILMGGCFGSYIEVSYNRPQQQPMKQQQHKQISGELQILDTYTPLYANVEVRWFDIFMFIL